MKSRSNSSNEDNLSPDVEINHYKSSSSSTDSDPDDSIDADLQGIVPDLDKFDLIIIKEETIK